MGENGGQRYVAESGKCRQNFTVFVQRSIVGFGFNPAAGSVTHEVLPGLVVYEDDGTERHRHQPPRPPAYSIRQSGIMIQVARVMVATDRIAAAQHKPL